MDNVKDITVEILISIRDEIRELREDTNKRFEQMDKRFEQMDKRFEKIDQRLEHIEADMRTVVSYFDRNYTLLANKVGELEGQFHAHVSSHN